MKGSTSSNERSPGAQDQPAPHEEPPRGPPPRLDYLDALRGLAVLGVIAVHTLQNFTTDFGASVIALGMYGVALFYVVSAFSLSLSLGHRATREGNRIRNYAIRRVFRIAPAFYLAVAFYLLKPFILPTSSAPRGVLELPWKADLSDVVQTLLFVNGWSYRAINLVVPGGWSVAVETNFYLVLPFLFRWATTLKRAILMLIGTMIGARVMTKMLYVFVVPHVSADVTGSIGIFNGMWLPSQLPVFVVGILWFVLHRRSQGLVSTAKQKHSILLAASALVAVVFAAFAPPFVDRVVPFTLRLSIAMLFCCRLLSLHPTKWLVNRFTIFVGKISYSAYLFHMVAIHLVLWLSHAVSGHAFGATPSFYLAFPVILALTCALAAVVYTYVEVPGQEWGRRWIKRLDSQAGETARLIEKT